MSDKEMYTAEDTQREIELLNSPSKQVTWSPFPRVKIELVIPPTVYPPRHDSDLLAQRISKFGPGRNKRLLEIGCGSGAISIFAASLGWDVSACDINPFSVIATKGNMEKSGYRAEIVEGGVGPEKIPFDSKFDLIVWNLPYLSVEEIDVDRLGPMEDAAMVDTDEIGLANRLIHQIDKQNLLADNGKILILGKNDLKLNTSKFAHRIFDRVELDDGDILELICLWNPWYDKHSYYVEQLGSTNSEIMNYVGIGTNLRARKQVAGRGRRERSWTSIEGSYAASWIVSEGGEISPGNLQLAGGLAVLNSLQNEQLNLKWPNDIFIKGRKVGGILAESRSNSEGFKAILGIGINMLSTNEKMDFPFASLDEITSISIERFHLRLHAELSSLIEEREDIPPVNHSLLREKVLLHLKKFGNPKFDGKVFDDFKLNQDGELVLSNGHIVKDGEDISWH